MFPNNENRPSSVLPVDENSSTEKEAVLAEVRLRFERSPYRELRRVNCDFHEGVLTLRGACRAAF